MNPRENMLSLYRRRGYEFPPVELNMCPTIQDKMKKAIGADAAPEEYFDYPEGFAHRTIPGPELIPAEDVDWRKFYPYELDPDTYFSPYGKAREGGYEGAYHLRRAHHPMAEMDSLEEMRDYPWPAWDFDNIDHMVEAVNEARAECAPSTGHMACTIWETAWGIRDMTKLMMDMATGDEKAAFVLDKVTADSVGRARTFARAGVDIIHIGDDIGMQDTIMMSLEMYREWLKPRLAGVIAAAREEKPDVLIFYHSCGYVEPFIPDLMEIGVDILNPVQPECMDFERLHAEYRDVLSFNGTLGTQTTMPFGTTDEVRELVRKNLDIAGAKGGLVVTPTHTLEPEVPWENIEAYVLACRDYGRA
ncbi:MAG: uroporphyrinogen decarboxylase family protein [Kiritimatiellia bacterium]